MSYNIKQPSHPTRFRFTAALVITAAALGAIAAPALAQAPAASQSGGQSQDINSKRVTLNLDNADIRYALKLLFTNAGANYTLDQAVQGTVTADLKDVSFRTALESMLRSVQTQSQLTYRVENGVYSVGIKVKPDDERPPDDNQPATYTASSKTKVARIQLNYADVTDITLALGGTVITSRFSGMLGGGRGGSQGMGGGNGMFGGGNMFGGGSQFGGGNVGVVNTGNGFGNFGNPGGNSSGGVGVIGGSGNSGSTPRR